MELSEEDISRLIHRGFKRVEICVVGEDGIPRLLNSRGKCVFLSDDHRSCLVYEDRPLGCKIYPVNCDEEGNILLDEFCKARGTLSKSEIRKKAKVMESHLKTIDAEARRRKKVGGGNRLTSHQES